MSVSGQHQLITMHYQLVLDSLRRGPTNMSIGEEHAGLYNNAQRCHKLHGVVLARNSPRGTCPGTGSPHGLKFAGIRGALALLSNSLQTSVHASLEVLPAPGC